MSQLLPEAEEVNWQPVLWQKPVLFFIGAIVGILVLNTGLALSRIRHLYDNSELVNQAHQSLENLGDMVQDMQTAESAMRAFVLTGDEQFLTPYEAVRNDVAARLETLQQLARENPERQEEVRKLEELTDAKLEFVQNVIDVRREQGFDAAKQIVARLDGYQLMQQIRSRAERIGKEERTLLAARKGGLAATYRSAVVNGIASVCLGLTSVCAFFWLLSRHLKAMVQSAAEVHGQRELLRATLASIGDGVIATDRSGRVTSLNRVAESLTGWSNAEAFGRPLEEVFRIISESYRQPIENPAARVLRDGIAVSVAEPALLRSRDGSERSIDDSASPILDARQKIVGAVLIFRDVVERRRTERMHRFLAEASAALAVLVDVGSTLQKVTGLAVPFIADWCSVDLLTADGTLQRVAITHVDPAMKQVADEYQQKYPPDPDSPHGIWEVVRSGTPELIMNVDERLLRKRVSDERLYRILQTLGLKSLMAVPLRSRGKVLGVITFVSARNERLYSDADLTIAVELAHRAAVAVDNSGLFQALLESDRRKDEFLALLAHELRNPLAPIRNALQILKSDALDPQTSAQALGMAERQVQHLTRLVDDLLDVSRIMCGKIQLRPERLDLAIIVNRAVETAQSNIEAKNHRLQINLPPQDLWVHVDQVRIIQVVSNLLTNAAKFTDAGGLIEISGRREGEVVVISVCDNGLGIEPEMLPHIFDMFVQAAPVATHSQGGLGIGLTLVKRLVELHNGRVTAHSDGLGKGTEIMIRLPADDTKSETNETASRTGAPAPRVSPKRRILVVDDNRDAAQSLAMLLKLMGHDARVADHGEAALRAVAEDMPEIVLLDIGMPGMDGYEVAQRLRRMPGADRVVLVALTGWGQDQDRQRSRDAGFDRHLTKPVEPAILQSVLDQYRQPTN